MNLELFIARRLHFARQGKRSLSRPAVRVAMVGVSVGLAVIIVSVAIVLGFKQEIRNKVIGFGSHIQLTNYDTNNTYESQPIALSDTLLGNLASIPEVAHLQPFATKTGIVKTATDFQGVVFKGVDSRYSWDFFRANLIEGATLNLADSLTSNSVIISSQLSKLMNLKLGDSFTAYFIQEQVRARKFTIEGIYSTHFKTFDELFIICDIRQIRRLNGWDERQASGIEVLVADFDRVSETAEAISDKLYRFDSSSPVLRTQTIRELNLQLFSWLDLLDMNVWVILFLMLGVAGFNMISGLLILILEQTNTIGILKSLGANNRSIRKIFLYHSFFLVGKGMLWGNLIGIGICLLQHYTGFATLDPETYYLTTVPVSLNLWLLIALNLFCFLVSVLMLIAPSYLITKINPAQAVRFE